MLQGLVVEHKNFSNGTSEIWPHEKHLKSGLIIGWFLMEGAL
jgi:hypothetical protein